MQVLVREGQMPGLSQWEGQSQVSSSSERDKCQVLVSGRTK